jgi:hypothetical protein
MRLAQLMSVMSLGLASASAALSPATEEQMICAPSSMFLGEVVSAKSVDCRKHANEECEPRNGALLGLRVKKVLQGSSDPMKEGEVIEAWTRVCNQKPQRIGKQWIDYCTMGARDVAVRRDGRPASDADVAKAFGGRTFWFARWAHGQQVDTLTRPEHALAIWKDICPTSPYRQR